MNEMLVGHSVGYSIFIIIVVALLTFGARFFPFAIFSKGEKPPAVISYLGNILPPAVMVMLVVYCIRYITPLKWPHGIPELISIVVVAVLYKFTKNYLLAMVGGTILYMIFVQVVFV